MANMISILGSTGSIGRQTLDVVEQLGLKVAAITAHSSVERVEEQARRFSPRLAVMTDEAAARDLAVRLAVCDLCLPDAPLVLDEALAAFDDVRAKRALELLQELSEQRQILLFSCHNRESQLT